MNVTVPSISGLLFTICLLASAPSSLSIEGVFVALNPMMQMAKLEPDPGRKAQMLKAAAMAARRIELRGDSLIQGQGDLTTLYSYSWR
jgi:hypothetical protein